MTSLARSRAVVRAVTRKECTVTLGSRPRAYDITADQLFDRLVVIAFGRKPSRPMPRGERAAEQRPGGTVPDAGTASHGQPFHAPRGGSGVARSCRPCR